MSKCEYVCPCCGSPLLFSFTLDGVAVQNASPAPSQEDIIKIAADLGIEIGLAPGGGE